MQTFSFPVLLRILVSTDSTATFKKLHINRSLNQARFSIRVVVVVSNVESINNQGTTSKQTCVFKTTNLRHNRMSSKCWRRYICISKIIQFCQVHTCFIFSMYEKIKTIYDSQEVLVKVDKSKTFINYLLTNIKNTLKKYYCWLRNSSQLKITNQPFHQELGAAYWNPPDQTSELSVIIHQWYIVISFLLQRSIPW